jgi:type VI protein secretion system component Hcp
MMILNTRRRVLTGVAMAALVAVTASTAAAAWGDRQPAQAATAEVDLPCPVPVDPPPLARTAKGYALLNGISGDAKKPAQRNEFLVTGVRFGVDVGALDLCDRSGRGDLTAELLVIDKPVDRASIGLLKAASEGTRFTQLRVRLAGAAATDSSFLVWTFSGLQVRGVRQLYSAKSLSERVSFTYERVTVRYGSSDVEITVYPRLPHPTDPPTSATPPAPTSPTPSAGQD